MAHRSLVANAKVGSAHPTRLLFPFSLILLSFIRYP